MTQMIVQTLLQLTTVFAYRERLGTWALPIGLALAVGLSIYAFAFSG